MTVKVTIATTGATTLALPRGAIILPTENGGVRVLMSLQTARSACGAITTALAQHDRLGAITPQPVVGA